MQTPTNLVQDICKQNSVWYSYNDKYQDHYECIKKLIPDSGI